MKEKLLEELNDLIQANFGTVYKFCVMFPQYDMKNLYRELSGKRKISLERIFGIIENIKGVDVSIELHYTNKSRQFFFVQSQIPRRFAPLKQTKFDFQRDPIQIATR